MQKVLTGENKIEESIPSLASVNGSIYTPKN